MGSHKTEKHVIGSEYIFNLILLIYRVKHNPLTNTWRGMEKVLACSIFHTPKNPVGMGLY
jgi:hypothetical protein